MIMDTVAERSRLTTVHAKLTGQHKRYAWVRIQQARTITLVACSRTKLYTLITKKIKICIFTAMKHSNLTTFWMCWVQLRHNYVGRNSLLGIATRYGPGVLGIGFRCGRDFPHLCGPAVKPTQPPCTIGTGGKGTGAWRWQPTPPSVEVKERVELHLYSPSVPSWSVLRWTLRHNLVWDVLASPLSLLTSYIYITYRTANLQTLYFIYLVNKYTYWIF
jgi:hypothetical protein